MYDAVITGAPTVRANTRFHQPGIKLIPTAMAAAGGPSASDAQKRRR